MAPNGQIKKTIVAVDDEEPLLKILTTFLEGKGYRVLTATDGKKGLSLIKEEKPDLVILDVVMPRMDGFRVLDKLKKDDKTMTIPVIMLTTRSSGEDIDRGISHLAEEYVPKPFDLEELNRSIEQTLQAR